MLTQVDFPLQAYEPKVQVPFLVLPGECPRKIEIERYGWMGGPVLQEAVSTQFRE